MARAGAASEARRLTPVRRLHYRRHQMAPTTFYFPPPGMTDFG
jgi:hypothetical protein